MGLGLRSSEWVIIENTITSNDQWIISFAQTNFKIESSLKLNRHYDRKYFKNAQ